MIYINDTIRQTNLLAQTAELQKPQTIPTNPIVVKTEVITYQPHRDSSTQYETRDGQCWDFSIWAHGADAYSCITDANYTGEYVGNGFDPCFILPNEKLLLCDVDITTGKGGFLLQPTKDLPSVVNLNNDIHSSPMIIQLADGLGCVPFRGTGMQMYDANKNEIVSNWNCGGNTKDLSNETIISFTTTGDVWVANVVKYSEEKDSYIAKSFKRVDIAKVWY